MSSSCSNERLGIMFLVSVNFMAFRVPKNLGCPWDFKWFHAPFALHLRDLYHCRRSILQSHDILIKAFIVTGWTSERHMSSSDT